MFSSIHTHAFTNGNFTYQNKIVKDYNPIWLDQDPGCDDAIALFMAVNHPKISLKGMTITGGNVCQEKCLHNCKVLLTAYDKQHIPIYKGIETPIMEFKIDENASGGFHGQNGLAEPVLQKYSDHSILPK